MGEALFANSMFVSYVKGTSPDVRIPYTQGTALTQEVINRLISQIHLGCVSSVQLDDETQETSLTADFRNGWSTVYIVKECENYFEFVNHQFPTSEIKLNITGDGPTPQKHATEDMELMSNIISYFAKTGDVYPACTWEHTIH